MDVVLAEYLGFCYGVRRAIKIAKSHAGAETCTLGPIIHNPQMVERLKAEGVGVVENLSEMSSGTVIIRSHGVGSNIYREIQAKGLKIVDATCPHVKKAQLSARGLAENGYSVVIIGEKNHPEVKSILEWTGGTATILETEAEAEDFAACKKLGVVSQTTVAEAQFQKIVTKLLNKSKDIRILRTICTATEQRQSAAMDLAAKVDVMLVVGGRNSANTTKLAKICAEQCKTFHIETAAEISPEWFDQSKKVGITAGASTPDWIIREVQVKCQMM